MKKYVSPQLEIRRISAPERITSLNDWLDRNGLTQAGITTYVLQS